MDAAAAVDAAVMPLAAVEGGMAVTGGLPAEAVVDAGHCFRLRVLPIARNRGFSCAPAGDGDRQRQDPRGCRAGRLVAAGGDG